MHTQALALWRAGGQDLGKRLRKAADKSDDFLSFWAALEHNFGASESDVLLVGIARFRDKINQAAEHGQINVDKLARIVSELEESAETDDEVKYWQAFELPVDVDRVSLDELGIAVIDYLDEHRPAIEELPSPVASEEDILLPMLRQIKEDVASLKAHSGVKICMQSSRSSSTSENVDFLRKKMKSKPWKICAFDFQSCLSR